MSDQIEILADSSLGLTKQEPLTIREKIVHLFEELEGNRDEQRQINTEFQTERQARMDTESQANHLRRQVQLAEVNLDNTTAKIEHLTTDLIDLVKVSEVARHICADLDNQLTAVRDKEIDLDEDLQKAKENSVEKDKRYQESMKKLTELQERFDHAERRSAIADKRNILLEQDIRQAYVEMKSMMQTQEKTRSRAEEYQKTIEDLQSRLKSAQQRTDESEEDVGKLQVKADKLREKLADERKKCHQIQKMIDTTSIS